MSDLIKRSDAIEAMCGNCGWRETQCDPDERFWCEDGTKIRRDIPSVITKEIKYYDEDDSVWKIGRVIVDE